MDKITHKLKELFGKINNTDPSKLRLNAGGHWRNIILLFVLGVVGVMMFSYYTFFTYFDRNIIAIPGDIEVEETDIGKYRNIEDGLTKTIKRYEEKQNMFNALLFEKPDGFADPSGVGEPEEVVVDEGESGEALKEADAPEETADGGLRYQGGQMGSVFQSFIDWLR